MIIIDERLHSASQSHYESPLKCEILLILVNCRLTGFYDGECVDLSLLCPAVETF